MALDRPPLAKINQSRTGVARRMRAVPRSIPAPVGGWNARDSLGEMDADDAVALVNWYPGTTVCEVRGGYTQFATGLGAQVETVMAYSGSTTSMLLGIAGGSVYDVTAGGAVGAAALTGLNNSRWQYVNVTTSGGNFLEMCNGVDGVYTFDGTTWTDRSGSITNVTAANLVGINVHKNRVWFVENGTLKAWYLPTQSIAGAAAALDMSAYAPHGGYIMAVATWTIDAGYGVDDLLVFITNNGDVLVWRGTDPSSANTWALVGVWWLGAPIGRRCMVKWKGDLLIITQDGIVPLSGALQSSRVDPRVALTDKIQQQVSAVISLYGPNFGWEVMPYPRQDALILNVPIQEGLTQQQYVMNAITGAWCNFQGWEANCWALHNDDIYFGGNAFVGKAWTTNADNGSAISADALQAFNYFNSPGQLKRFTMMRPTLLCNGPPSIQASVNVDFDTAPPTSALGTAAIGGALWDAGLWDTANWADNLSISRVWQGAAGLGYCAGTRLSSSTNGLQLQWVATDLVMEPGGVI